MLEFIFAVLVGGLPVLAAVFLYRVLKGRTPPKPFPPGWNNLPADPKMGDLRKAVSSGSIHQYLQRQHSGGRCPVISFWWRNERVISTCSPEAFKSTESLFNRARLITGECFEPLDGPTSIQSLNGAEWETRKKLLYGTIRGRKLESFFSDFVCVALEAKERWLSTDQPIRLMREMFSMTLKAILCTSLGNIFDDDSGMESLADAYLLCKHEMDERVILGSPPPNSQRELDFQKNLKDLRDILRRMMNARKKQTDGKELPLLDALLASGASEDCVLDDMVTFVGGFHTSGYYATWTFYYLAQHPDVQEKLLREIEKKVEGEQGDKLKMYTLASNSFLRQVLDEALRMSTTASFTSHYSDEDMVVDGYHVPAKTPILHAIGVSLSNEAIWEKPNLFNPDRFGPGSNHSKRGPEFRPFGVTCVRRCPANQFTYFMVSVYVTILLQEYVFEADDGGAGLKKLYGIATKPEGEVKFRVKCRH